MIAVQPTAEEDAALLICPHCFTHHRFTGWRCTSPPERKEA